MRLIMFPHLKLFSICSVTSHPWSSANIRHAAGLAQARPHDAMHLPSYYPIMSTAFTPVTIVGLVTVDTNYTLGQDMASGIHGMQLCAEDHICHAGM